MILNSTTEDKLRWIFNSSLIIVCFSILFTFYDLKFARIAFFITSYLTIVGLCFRKFTLAKSEKLFISALFLLGLSKVLWFAIEYIGQDDFDIYNSYLASGKRLMIAAVIALFFLGHKRFLTPKHIKTIKYGLLISFITASVVGVWQVMHNIPRVDFFQSRATGAAYMYSALASAVIFIFLQDAQRRFHYFSIFVIFIIAYLVLFATGTRNTMVSFPVTLLLIGLLKFRHLGWKSFVLALCTMTLLIGASYTKVIKPRIDATYQEYQIFEQSQGNDMGSLTTRLAMWKVGIQCFSSNFFGMSQQERKQWFQNYVDNTQRDKSSLAYVDVHLHNEVIETASLQGILGVIVLLFYYFINIMVSWRYHNPALLSVMILILITGLTDVIYISRDQTIFFPVIMLLTILWQGERKRLNKPL